MAKVLIIEDDPAQIEILTAAIVSGGHQVISAKTAVGGLEYAKSELPDIIILDEILPDMAGTDVLRELKVEGANTQGIPVILFTGYADRVVEKDALELGASMFILKFETEPSKLNIAINDVLKAQKPQQPPK